jgi:thymidylate synthase
VYGVQWRHWAKYRAEQVLDGQGPGGVDYFSESIVREEVDQLADVIQKLKTNPTDRRILLTAWNPGELDQVALPPCHMFCQFYLSNDRKLSCQMYQRSVDTFLGLPFNIASYALLTHMVAHVIGATPGMLTLCLGDTHIYMDHMEQVKEQLLRTPFAMPELKINRQVTSIDDFKMEDFELIGYESHAAIKAKMSA